MRREVAREFRDARLNIFPAAGRAARVVPRDRHFAQPHRDARGLPCRVYFHGGQPGLGRDESQRACQSREVCIGLREIELEAVETRPPVQQDAHRRAPGLHICWCERRDPGVRPEGGPFTLQCSARIMQFGVLRPGGFGLGRMAVARHGLRCIIGDARGVAGCGIGQCIGLRRCNLEARHAGRQGRTGDRARRTKKRPAQKVPLRIARAAHACNPLARRYVAAFRQCRDPEPCGLQVPLGFAQP